METVEVPTESIGRVDDLVTDLARWRAIEEEKERELKAIRKEMSEVESSLMKILESVNLTSFKGKAGSIALVTKSSVKIPQDPESKARFFQYLKDRGIFEDLVTVHSATLNKFYNSEEELALKAGTIDFSVPGIETPTPYTSVRFTASK